MILNIIFLYLIYGIFATIGYYRYSYEEWRYAYGSEYEEGGSHLEYLGYTNFDQVYWLWSICVLATLHTLMWPRTLWKKKPFDFTYDFGEE